MARRLLRTFGLVLIALPEPFTTPVGASLLVASYLLRKQKADNYHRLQILIKEYLRSFQPPGYISSVPARRQLRAFPGHSRDGGTHRVGIRGYAWPGQPRMPVKVVHHTLDKDLWRQYRNTDGSRAGFQGYWSAKSAIKAKAVHHSINRNLIAGTGRMAASV